MDEEADGLMADTLIAGTTLVEKESRSIGDVPIGGIVAWAKSLSGVPNLTEGWVECDGSVLVDALSPLNGQTIPDLNGGEFLEGRTTSGSTGGSATMAHDHISPTTIDSSQLINSNKYGTQAVTSVTSDNVNRTDTTTATRSLAKVSGASNTENRPPFYTVVWIMRVR